MPPFANIRIINIVFSESKDVKSSEIEIQSLDKVYLFLFSSCFPPLSLPQSLSSDETKETGQETFIFILLQCLYCIPCCCRGSTWGPPWHTRWSSRWCWWWGECWCCQMTDPPLFWLLTQASGWHVWIWSDSLKFIWCLKKEIKSW